MMLNKLSLNTIGLNRIGLNRIGKPSRGSSVRPYIDPEVLASLKAVCICYGKSNDDPDRAIVKNLVDPDNPFIISNAAYTEGSGYADKDSPYYGAFVTDGVDDLITSTKTVQEMGITDEITVVSMIGQLSTPNVNNYTNTIRNQIGTTGSYNKVSAIDKTGIYGYSFDSSLKYSIINDILGDKQDYSVSSATQVENISAKYLVQGWIDINGLARELSSVAWYWTIIANKVLTSDQINQVIAYYNLDRCVEPTVLYDVKRQGLSNDTPDSDWYLKDFSKNGFDMSLFNFAKKGNSGIGKYEVDFTSWKKAHFTDEVNTSSSKIEITGTLTTNSILINTSSTPMYNVEIHSPNKSIVIYFQYDDGTGIKRISLVEGINELPSANESLFVTSDRLNSKGITITQIPFNADALYFDGVDDFGKAIGLPVYKDYTVIADRELFNAIGCILSNDNPGAFIFETSSASTYSFGEATSSLTIPTDKQIRYQTKYSYNGQNISIGAVKEGTSNMWLGTIRDNDARFRSAAIYSLMTFPYSMSEFLIERQLKKHKLGTLYPDMVEFRPIVNSNVKYQDIIFRNTSTGEDLVAGQYYDLGTISISIKPLGCDEATAVKVNNVNAEFNSYDESSGYYRFDSVVTKSPQKIDITIDEYIRYEDIVQPYPDMIDLKQDNKTITWGDKLKVGSEIIYYNDYNSNPLSKLYNLGTVLYNGNFIYSGNIIEVKKDMVFTSKSKWKLDNNEPKCILSPSRLRIPNSSYKILGYIPDISGHGNHGKINNSAYAGMSGANGYVENFTTWGVYNGAILTDNTIKTNSNFNPVNSWVAYKGANTILNSFSVNITGIPEGGILNFRVNADTFIELSNGRNDLSFDNIPITVSSGFRITKGGNLDWSNLVIQQIGKYEGAYCLDGVDDFITIPTTVGGKQVLMKVNWQSSIEQGLLYDQRGTAFAIWNSDKYNDDETDTIPAYSAINGGNTYIDGILNKNILASQLRNITHNIVATNTMLNGSSVSPTIGCRTEHDAYFTNMSLYDFMLFDEISTDEEILTLNEYVGIEGNTDDLFTENN